MTQPQFVAKAASAFYLAPQARSPKSSLERLVVAMVMMMIIVDADDGDDDDDDGDDDDDDCERLVLVVARRKTFTTGCGGSRPAGKRSLPKKKATL